MYTKICQACGKEFQTKVKSQMYCKDVHYFPCPVCGKPVAKTDRDFNRPHACCSNECRHKLLQSHMKEKVCVLCGKKFKPRSGCNTICSDKHYRECVICGNKFEVTSDNIEVTTCCKECRMEQTRRTCIERYGVDHPMKCESGKAAFKKSMLKKYNVESPLQCPEIRQRVIRSNRERFGADWALSNDGVRRKIHQTNLSRYGNEEVLRSSQIRDKVNATNLLRYGGRSPMAAQSTKDALACVMMSRYGRPSPMQCPALKEKARNTRLEHFGQWWTSDMADKAKATCIDKYGVDNASKSPEIVDKIKHTMVERYGVSYGIMLSKNNKFTLSKTNQKFGQILSDAGLSISYEFPLENRVYDICIKSQKTLIEIDPSSTHNTLGNHWTHKGISPNYHLEKTLLANKNGYRCIHVFDWDDWSKVIPLVLQKKIIYARKCKLFLLKPKVCNDFLNQFHLQGSAKGQLVCIGLIYEGQIVQVMTFGKPRYDSSHTAELIRLCTRHGYAVVGGAEKMMKFAKDNFWIENIISYCDVSKFNGDVYARLGMSLIRTTEPQEVWSKGSKRITANLLRQRGFDQIFKTNYGKGTSNTELMIQNKWLPVYDCGQYVYDLD